MALSDLSTEDLLALKAGDLSKVSTKGLELLRQPQVSAPGPSAAERVASDPITKGAEAITAATPAELLAGSAPGRFLTSPARGLMELGGHLSPVQPNQLGQLAQELGAMTEAGRKALGNEGMDIAGAAGTAFSPPVMKAGNIFKVAGPAMKLLPRIGNAAAAGAVAGAETPTEGADFWKEKALQMAEGAGLSGALPAVGSMGKGLLNTIYKAFEPIIPGGPESIFTRYAQKLSGGAKDQIANALAAAKQLVPGSEPTAGEAVSGVPGATQLAAHQRAVSRAEGVSPSFAEREAQQQGARADLLSTVTKTPAELSKAEGSRAAQAMLDYDTAFNTTARSDPALRELASDPYFRKAMPAAANLSKSKGAEVPGFMKESAKWSENSLIAPEGGELATITTHAAPGGQRFVAQSENGSILGSGPDLAALKKQVSARFAPMEGAGEGDLTRYLHYIKVGLDKQLNATGETALSRTEKEAVQGVKDKLLAWMDSNNPAYAIARARFATASQPINEMQAAKLLQEKLHAPLSNPDTAPIERAGLFAGALRDVPQTMKAATGYESPELPEKVKGVAEAIAGDLSRRAQFERLARGTRLGGSPGDIESPLPNLLYRPAMLTNYIAKKFLGHDLESNVNKVAAEAYLNPAKLAEHINSLPLQERTKAIAEALSRRYANMPLGNMDPLAGLAYGGPAALETQLIHGRR